MRQNNSLFLLVTADQYELPICICESAQELANKLGMTKSGVYKLLEKENNGVKSGRRIVKVNIEAWNEAKEAKEAQKDQ